MGAPFRPDRRAERALLTRARRGDVEALRGMLHRYSSLVWGACALASPDERVAGGHFVACWDYVLRSLRSSRLAPDLAGLLLMLCGARLAEEVPEAVLHRAMTAAAHLAVEGEALEAPAEALRAVEDTLAEHGERLGQETTERRLTRRERLFLPAALGLAVLFGMVVAYRAATLPSWRDVEARCLRTEVVQSDLVSRLRDCAAPPFTVSDRDPVEVRQFEQINLVFEELCNMPPRLRSSQLAGLRERVIGLDLADFAVEEADKAQGDTRLDLLRVARVLEELTDL